MVEQFKPVHVICTSTAVTIVPRLWAQALGSTACIVSCIWDICIYLFVFVLMGCSLLPNALRSFKVYCAPPNLGKTRTWICRLNFAQRPIFSGLRFFNEPEISDSGPQLKVPPRRLVLKIFTSWKNPSTLAGFEPANLGSRDEHVTPWHWGRLEKKN